MTANLTLAHVGLWVVGLAGIGMSKRSLGKEILAREQAEENLRQLNTELELRVAARTAELQHRARQLQNLTLELTRAEDRERKRIAALLHEDLQQHIAGAKFRLGLLTHRTGDEPSQQAIVAAVDEMLKEAIEKSRSLSHDLSPAVLHQNDLAEALSWLACRMKAQHGLAVRLDAAGEMTLKSEALTIFLFRAAQELLYNAIKHAGINEVGIRVRCRGGRVRMMVSDRGRGFDPRELEQASGFGLFSIRERVDLLGGHMKIRSVKGKGSVFLITVPDVADQAGRL